jgi:PST family polysaccharide transporter/lipopolysaccharide exporter
MNAIPEDLSGRIVRGGTALMAARIANRALQLIQMMTIARWLGPQEMGVYAVAALLLTTLEFFSETGLRQALIQRKNDISPYLLPVRTVQAIRGLVLGLFLYLSAPAIATFFDSPDSRLIIRVVALIPVITGFEPLYLTQAQKELRFSRMAVLQLSGAMIGLSVGITAAYLKPDAWSLVWANLARVLVITVGAHLLSEKNKLGFSFRWSPLRDISTFGFWVFLSTITAYAFRQGGDWVIGRLLDVNALALYRMTFVICTTITMEFGSVVKGLAFPVYSKLQNDQQLLQTAFRNTFGLIAIVTLGVAALVAGCARDFYYLVLGEKWVPALPLVPWLTIWGICGTFGGAQGGIFRAVNKPKYMSITTLCMTLLFTISVYPMTRWLGGLGVAITIAGISLLMQFVRYHLLSNLLKMSYFAVLQHIFIPSVACVGSVLITSFIRSMLTTSNHLLGIIVSAICICSFYVVILALNHRWLEPSPRELGKRLLSLLGQKDLISTNPFLRKLRGFSSLF